MRALFITPMKAPDDPIPSGDRTIARATEHMLQRAGFETDRPTQLTSWLATPDPVRMVEIEADAAREIARLKRAPRPDLVFTYHCYDKAPDLIGPAIATYFQTPYVIAEASLAKKRAQGSWAQWYTHAENALRTASLILIPNPLDRDGLSACCASENLCDWPLFIDDTVWPIMPRWTDRPVTHLLTVAMMRPGDKMESYRLLAQALKQRDQSDWHLTIVGDGPARDDVLALFSCFGSRVAWRGQLHGMALADAYADADLLVWPAINEALGMVFLEAALQGCPSLAGDEGGVSTLVHHEKTGWLVRPRDVDAFIDGLDALIGQTERLEQLAQGALAMAKARDLEQAAAQFRALIASRQWIS